MIGVYWYVGCPGAGKTTVAYRDLQADIIETGRPALVLDSEGVPIFKHVPHAESVEDVIKRLWGGGASCAYIPESSDEVDALARAIRSAGDIHVLVDEASYWTTSRTLSPDFGRLFRAFRHANLTLRLTTQHLGDVHPAALQCTTKLYAFRCLAPSTLDRLRKDFGLDADKLPTLERGAYETWTGGFEHP